MKQRHNSILTEATSQREELLKTKFGAVLFTIHKSADVDMLRDGIEFTANVVLDSSDARHGGKTGASTVVRKRAYRGSITFNVKDGRIMNHPYPYINIYDLGSRFTMSHASPAAEKAIKDEMQRVVQDYLDKNPKIMRSAEISSLEYELNRLAEDKAELLKKIKEIDLKSKEISQKLKEMS